MQLVNEKHNDESRTFHIVCIFVLFVFQQSIHVGKTHPISLHGISQWRNSLELKFFIYQLQTISESKTKGIII